MSGFGVLNNTGLFRSRPNAVGSWPMLPTQPKLHFKVYGMDCAEEVAVLMDTMKPRRPMGQKSCKVRRHMMKTQLPLPCPEPHNTRFGRRRA